MYSVYMCTCILAEIKFPAMLISLGLYSLMNINVKM